MQTRNKLIVCLEKDITFNMKKIQVFFIALFIAPCIVSNAQEYIVQSPDNKIIVTISNGEKLTYSVSFKGEPVINPSMMGFEFKGEPAMTGNFVIRDQRCFSFYLREIFFALWANE